MEDQNLIADLVADWLHIKFPNSIIEVTESQTWGGPSNRREIMVDGIGVAEIFENLQSGPYSLALCLLTPTYCECTIVSLADPESLPLLTNCVQAHLDSTAWRSVMENNRGHTDLLITHRSSLGYKKTWK